jgi:carbonic anhydrase
VNLSALPLPKYLWIDCLDNRALPNHIVGLPSHEILVYRNLAHQINHGDLNCLAVLQYAVETLRIKHIIICGHYDCALFDDQRPSKSAELVENWLYPIHEASRQYDYWLSPYQSRGTRLHKLCEINVIEQVLQLGQGTVVQRAWQRQQELTIHGWVYSPDNGLLHDLAMDIASQAEIVPKFDAAIYKCVGKA